MLQFSASKLFLKVKNNMNLYYDILDYIEGILQNLDQSINEIPYTEGIIVFKIKDMDNSTLADEFESNILYI
jgi:hypothetical protein